MPLTNQQLVRQRIQDFPAYYDNGTFVGNGLDNTFKLQHSNLTTASAYVPSAAAAGWSATGATFNGSGYVTFAQPISAQSAFRLTYVHSVFSDAVIDEYVSAGGVLGASLQCAYDLMFDGLKRAAWRSPDGAEYDDTKAREQLKDIISALKEEQMTEATQGGGFWSWAETQGDW